MVDPEQSIFFIIFSQLHIQIKRRRELLHKMLHRIRKLPAVIVYFHHLFYFFQTDHIPIWEPVGRQYFIRRTILPHQSIRFCIIIHKRTVKYFQESKLQLIWMHCIDLIK